TTSGRRVARGAPPRPRRPRPRRPRLRRRVRLGRRSARHRSASARRAEMMRSSAIARITALALAIVAAPIEGSRAMTDGEVERLVAQHVKTIVPADGAGGGAVAVPIEGRTLVFNYRFPPLAPHPPVTP